MEYLYVENSGQVGGIQIVRRVGNSEMSEVVFTMMCPAGTSFDLAGAARKICRALNEDEKLKKKDTL